MQTRILYGSSFSVRTRYLASRFWRRFDIVAVRHVLGLGFGRIQGKLQGTIETFELPSYLQIRLLRITTKTSDRLLLLLQQTTYTKQPTPFPSRVNRSSIAVHHKAPLNTMTPEITHNTNHHNRKAGKRVTFRELQEYDIHPATYYLESEREIRSLWYTPDEHHHMLREYKMTSEIQTLVETLHKERARRLGDILLKAQKRSGSRRPSSPSSPTKRFKGSTSPRNSYTSKTTRNRCRNDSVALSKLIVQLSSQRNRVTHLMTSESVKNMIHTISATAATSNCPPHLVDEASESSHESHAMEDSGELLRAKQKFNRLYRQLNRALAAR